MHIDSEHETSLGWDTPEWNVRMLPQEEWDEEAQLCMQAVTDAIVYRHLYMTRQPFYTVGEGFKR